MPTVIAHHNVKDTEHWLASPRRMEFLEPFGVTASARSSTRRTPTGWRCSWTSPTSTP